MSQPFPVAPRHGSYLVGDALFQVQRAMHLREVHPAELARRLGWSRSAVSQMLKPSADLGLARLERIGDALAVDWLIDARLVDESSDLIGVEGRPNSQADNKPSLLVREARIITANWQDADRRGRWTEHLGRTLRADELRVGELRRLAEELGLSEQDTASWLEEARSRARELHAAGRHADAGLLLVVRLLARLA